MLTNLKELLRVKNISNKKLAELLGVTEKTVYLKLAENTQFNLGEIKKIHTFLFPEYKFEFLFASDTVV